MDLTRQLGARSSEAVRDVVRHPARPGSIRAATDQRLVELMLLVEANRAAVGRLAR